MFSCKACKKLKREAYIKITRIDILERTLHATQQVSVFQ